MNIDIKAIIKIFSYSIIFYWSKLFNNTYNIQPVRTGSFIDERYLYLV